VDSLKTVVRRRRLLMRLKALSPANGQGVAADGIDHVDGRGGGGDPVSAAVRAFLFMFKSRPSAPGDFGGYGGVFTGEGGASGGGGGGDMLAELADLLLDSQLG